MIRSKRYYRCGFCGGIFMDSSDVLSPDAERKRYALHENTLENAGYRRYLENCISAITGFQAVRDAEPAIHAILDWGSGPEPALVSLLSALGYAASGYDPNFAPELPADGVEFDLITCIEVAEHFCAPRDDFLRAASYLRAGGFFAVRTGFLPIRADIGEFFGAWWYREDPTHIAFYTEQALVSSTEPAGLELVAYASKDIALLRKRR